MAGGAAVKISFLGGASSIGASCALVETDGANLLVDCGVRFDPGNALPDLAQLSGRRIDAILLTHAHTDHSGALPVVCDAFPGVPVYATPPTADLVGILLRDALKLMAGPDREGELPLYTPEQAARAVEALRPAAFDETLDVFGVKVTFCAAGHILGAAMVHIDAPGGRVLFTGDYSVGAQLTVPALMRPSLAADVVVSEATYGARLHEDRRAAERRLVDQVREVTAREGRVLVPAFAIGRSQEVIRILRRAFARGELERCPVFVDGMVRAACAVYARHERYTSRQIAREVRHGTHPFYDDTIVPVERPADRARAIATRPCVVVASSGMLAGGASTLYAREFASDERDAILITGYQDEESPGRALLELAAGGPSRELRLGDRSVGVRCSVASYALSAHADRMQMAALIESLRPRAVVLVHGDTEAKRALAASLSCRDVVLAEDGQSVVRGGGGAAAGATDAGLPLPEPGQVDRVRAILGPPRDESLRDRDIAQAWFGRPAARRETDVLVARLEALGLARRDDRRRARVWVLAPGESPALGDDAATEERLKAENPKGRLLEICTKLRCEPPAIDVTVEGACHVARMTLALDGAALASGPQRAPSRKAAEQLAAASLLALVEARTRPGGATPVDEARANELRGRNPKGRLLEWCAARRSGAVELESRPITGGYAARVVVRDADGSARASGWYAASGLKAAEQAAADELLAELEADAPRTSPSAGDPAPQIPAPDGSAVPGGAPASVAANVPAIAAGRDARMVLNEMRQVGLIGEFAYEFRGQAGPSHRPVFCVVAWAARAGSPRVETGPVEAPSKKAAEKLAAERLLSLLGSPGECAGPAADA